MSDLPPSAVTPAGEALPGSVALDVPPPPAAVAEGKCADCGHVFGSDDHTPHITGDDAVRRCAPCNSKASKAAAGAPEKKKKPRKRAGTVTKGADGKGPAKPAGDGRVAQPAFDPGFYADKWDIWRVNDKGGSYYMRDPYEQKWMCLTESHLVRWLQSFGLEAGDNREPVREVEKILLWVQARRKLNMVMSLAGHRPGVVKIGTLRILVPDGPELLEAVQGEWDVLRKLIEGMFCIPIDGPEMPHHFQVFVKGKSLPAERTLEIWRTLVRQEAFANEEKGEEDFRWVLDQTPIIYSWLKLMLEVLYRRMAGEDVARNGHALIIAGEPDGGKSLLLLLLKRLLGERMADVEQFLTGKTSFNSDATGAEVLRISDAPLSTKMEDRLLLGEFIKHVVAESEHRVHGKGRDASCTLPLVQRLIWLHNADQENLRQVPPMKPELRDKVMWLRANAVAMSAPTSTLNDYMAFGNALKSQLPALAWWLMNEFVVPESLVGGRFGILGVQEPSLIRELYEDSPSAELLELLDAARWEVLAAPVNLWDFVGSRTETEKYGEVSEDGLVWTGGHTQLQKLLTGEGCSMAGDFAAMFKVGKLHRLLGRLKKEEPRRVEQHRTKTARLWRIMRPLQ